MNLLISTTQVWNPGDDFIRFGVMHILERALKSHELHFAAWDRNPRLQHHNSGRNNWQANVHCGGDTFTGYDGIVIAGTPEWSSSCVNLYGEALSRKWPVYALGLGAESREHLEKHTSEVTLRALAAASVVTTRDELAHSFLTERGVKNTLLPCPAMLAPAYVYADAVKGLFYSDSIPAPIPGSWALVTSDVPEILEKALDAHAYGSMNQKMTLVCHSSHERNTLNNLGYRPIYEHDPYRLLRALLTFERLTCGRLHAALPCLGAGNGRKVSLFPNVSDRIHRGFNTATELFSDADHLLEQYVKAITHP